MKTRVKKHLQNKKGFTLVEMIVVMVILGILLSGGVFGYLSYIKNAEFKKNNDYAKSIFSAAQSQLSYYKSGGLLEEFAEKTKDAPVVSKEVAAYAKDSKSNLKYLQTTKGAEGIEDTLLYELTKDYIHDKSIYDAAIRIELDPSSGRVFSVCYNGKKATFSKEDVTLAKREVKERKKTGLGYYETDIVLRSVTNPETEGGDPPEVEEAKLINEEVLKIEMSFANDQIQNIRNGKYLVELRYVEDAHQNEEKDKKVLSSFVINDGSALNTLPEGDTNKRLTTEVNRVVEKNKSDCYFQTYIKDNKLGIVLDAMDLEAARIHYNKLMANKDAYNSADYSKTSSALRLGVLAAKNRFEIEAKITVLSKDDEEIGTYLTKMENPFMDSKELYNAKDYMIYPRHVYNIRFDQGRKTSEQYILKKDITWGAIEPGLETIAVFDNAKDDNNCLLKKDDAYFPAIPELSKNSTLLNGEGTQLSKFLIKPFNTLGNDKGDYPKNLGLAMTNEGLIQGVKFNEFKVEDTGIPLEGVGVIAGKNEASIIKSQVVNSNINAGESKLVGGALGIIKGNGGNTQLQTNSVENTTVIGKDNVGGLAAESEIALSDFKVLNTTVEGKGDNVGGVLAKNTKGFGYGAAMESLKVKGINNVGALAGSSEGYLNVGTITIAGDNVVEGAESNIGGLVGMNTKGLDPHGSGSKTIENFTITGKNNVGGLVGYNIGKVNDIGIKGASVMIKGGENSVGGLVGYNDESGILTVEGNAITIEGLDLKAGDNTGGLVGYNLGTLAEYEIKNATIKGGNAVGGMVGQNLSAIPIKRSNNASQLTGMNVEGGDNVGGVTGYNEGQIIGYAIKSSLIKGQNSVGGIAGYNQTDCEIKGESLSNNKLLFLDDLQVSGQNYIGGVIGSNDGKVSAFEIRNSAITGQSYVGGVIGDNASQGIITGAQRDGTYMVYRNLTVTGEANHIGGISGYNSGQLLDVLIQDSQVSGVNSVGGVSGFNENGGHVKGGSQNINSTIWMFSGLTVTGDTNVGSIIGDNEGLVDTILVQNSTITGNDGVGGVAGSNRASGKITGITLLTSSNAEVKSGNLNVTGNNNVGDFVGYNEGNVVGFE